MNYTIGEVSEKTGIPASTLRYYEQMGLIGPLDRSHGVRVFSDRDIGQLHLLGCLKQSGLSIAQMQQFCSLVREGDETLHERLELFQSRRQAVEQQMDTLQQVLNVLNLKCWYYEKACRDGSEKLVSSLSVEELPDQYRNTAVWLSWETEPAEE